MANQESYWERFWARYGIQWEDDPVGKKSQARRQAARERLRILSNETRRKHAAKVVRTFRHILSYTPPAADKPEAS